MTVSKDTIQIACLTRAAGFTATVVAVVTYTVQQLEANISALEGTLARGELTVEYSDRRVTYRAVAELERALQYFKKLLAQVEGTARPKLSYAVAIKGLES